MARAWGRALQDPANTPPGPIWTAKPHGNIGHSSSGRAPRMGGQPGSESLLRRKYANILRMTWFRVFRRADASRMDQGGRQKGCTRAVRSEKYVRCRRTMWARIA